MDDIKKNLVGKPIGETQIANGMHLCYMNAKALASESGLLKENSHYARALSLIILALEELGKIPIMTNALFIKNEDDTAWKKYWKLLSNHKFKLRVWSHYGKLLAKSKMKGYGVVFPVGIEGLVDTFKQLGFYVNFFKDDFISPDNFARDNSEWLEYLVQLTNDRLASFEPIHGSLESSKRLVGMIKDMVKTMEDKGNIKGMEKAINEQYSKLMKDEERK